jgi:hypothetical protein
LGRRERCRRQDDPRCTAEPNRPRHDRPSRISLTVIDRGIVRLDRFCQLVEWREFDFAVKQEKLGKQPFT